MEIESVKEKLKSLRLKAFAENLQQIIEMAAAKNRTTLQALGQLVDIELEAKRKNRVIRLFKESKLTDKTTIDQFDFHFHKSRKNHKSLILNLMDLEFISQSKDVILMGNTGVGKTFLAKCIAYASVQAGIRTLFTTATNMINHLIAAQADHSLLIADWGNIFDSTTVATAIADRLVYNSEVLIMEGKSYRKKNK